MRSFNWEEFKEGNVAVNCVKSEEFEDFLKECKRNNIEVNEPSIREDRDFSLNCYDFCDGELDSSHFNYWSVRNYKIIEWEIDEMKEEKKVYKIQDLFKDEFVGKKFRIANLGDFDNGLYEISKEVNKYEMIDRFGEDINLTYNLSGLLGFEFELVEEEPEVSNKINKESRIYIAGSLFNQGEVVQRKSEEELLRQNGYKNIYNPINAPCNNKEDLPTSADIFWGDTEEILDSELVIADLSNATDLGVGCELGIIWACNHLHFLSEEGLTIEEILDEMKKKKLVAHLSDIRKSTAHQYRGNGIPVGFNQYMIGLVEDIGVIKDNFKEVLEELKGGL